jgi:hypothetical protein
VDDSQLQSARRNRVSSGSPGQKGLSAATPMNKQKERIVPAFATEAEEAEWWYNNRNVHGKQLLAAVRAGEAKILTKDELRRRPEMSGIRSMKQMRLY